MKPIETESETNGKRVIPQLSVDAQLLAKRLEQVLVGEVIEYKDLNSVIKGNTQNGSRGALNAARKTIQREKQIVFEPVLGKGLKRLTDSEIVGTGTAALAKIRRSSKRAVRKLACAEYDKLKPEEQTRFNAVGAMLGALHQASKERNLKVIEGECAVAKAQLSFNATFDLFKSK